MPGTSAAGVVADLTTPEGRGRRRGRGARARRRPRRARQQRRHGVDRRPAATTSRATCWAPHRSAGRHPWPATSTRPTSRPGPRCRTCGVSGHGRVVMVTSVTGAAMAMRGEVAYAAAKAGLVGLTRALAVDEARHGLTVNAVAPGLDRDRVADRGRGPRGAGDPGRPLRHRRRGGCCRACSSPARARPTSTARCSSSTAATRSPRSASSADARPPARRPRGRLPDLVRTTDGMTHGGRRTDSWTTGDGAGGAGARRRRRPGCRGGGGGRPRWSRSWRSTRSWSTSRARSGSTPCSGCSPPWPSRSRWGAGLALATRRGAALDGRGLVALVGGLAALAVVAFPTRIDRHESFVEQPNERSSCVGLTFRHYPPGTFDASLRGLLRRPRAAGCPRADAPAARHPRRLLDSGGDPSRAAPGAQHRAPPRVGHLAGRPVGLRARRLPPHLARASPACWPPNASTSTPPSSRPSPWCS